VLQALTPAVRLDDVDLVVPASIGIAVQGEAGSSIASLLRSADRAMYEAKAAGGAGWRRALPAPVEDPSTRTPTGDELRQALRRDQIVVHYQPQVDAYDGTVLGFEALVRWQHPHLGLLAPAAIVPLADRSGLMRELLSSVVDRAVHDHVRLQELRPGSTISVNVTARNLLDQGLVIDIEQTLARHGTAAAQLTLEIVEPPAASVSIGGVLAGLERLGCSVSVQEFGTGQASLIALHSYRAIREIKVAPELTGAVLVDPAARRLVRAMVSTAHGLGVRVVGEGVESAELVRSLRDLGCDRLQGFHILPPAPLDDLEGWLARPDRPDLRSDLAHNGVR
jgi:EAL domain-containing protein (putative c-di-GMP-specific phosphodiesterase class I)